MRSDQAAAVVFAMVEVCGLFILMSWGRGQTFTADDLDFLAVRRATSLHGLFAAHIDHWVTLPVLAYRLLWWLVGMRSYVPYQLLVVGLHLTAAALLRVVMRRAGINEWIATIAATVFVFFGAGVEDIVIAFQITFVGALVFGLVQLLLADHDGRLSRRDWLGLGAGFIALLCSGVGVVLVISTALMALLRRGWRIALFHAAPLAAVYLGWYELIGQDTSQQLFHTSTWGERAAFVRTGIAGTFDALGQIPAGGYLIAIMLVAGLAYLISTSGWSVLRGRAAAPVAMLGGAVAMLVVTSIGRAGKPLPVISAAVALQGSSHARQSRVLHITVALTLPALALAADALLRRSRFLAIAAVAILVIGVPSNFVNHDVPAFEANSTTKIRPFLLDAHAPISARLPRGFQVAPYLKIGWLVDGGKSGRIPNAPHVRPVELATTTLYLAFSAYVPQLPAEPCVALTGPMIRTAPNGAVTVKGTDIKLFALLDDGTRSVPFKVNKGQTFRVRGGPVRLEFVPAGPAPAEVCGRVTQGD